jgi:hypothetical protein
LVRACPLSLPVAVQATAAPLAVPELPSRAKQALEIYRRTKVLRSVVDEIAAEVEKKAQQAVTP